VQQKGNQVHVEQTEFYQMVNSDGHPASARNGGGDPNRLNLRAQSNSACRERFPSLNVAVDAMHKYCCRSFVPLMKF
jgi:hypothetical protein